MWPFKNKADAAPAVMPPNQTAIAGKVARFEANEKLIEPLVERAIASVRKETAARKPAIREAFSYGAIGIDPKHLVIWYIFQSQSDTVIAKQTGFSDLLEIRSREALRL